MDGLALKHPEDKVQLFTQVRCIVTPHSSSSVLELGFPHSVFPLALPSEAGRRDMTLALTLAWALPGCFVWSGWRSDVFGHYTASH